MLTDLGVQSNPVNSDTEGVRESVPVINGLNLDEMWALSLPGEKVKFP